MKDITKPTSTNPEEPIIYLEADEEITAATSRMLASASKEVRIVVPKRSTLLQSVVNQKLLKRAADNAGKNLILVTADRTATHLAGQVGIPVAASVKAEAQIPQSTDAPEADTSDIIEDATEIAAVAAVAKAAAGPKPAYAKPMMKSEPKINNPFAPADDQVASSSVAPKAAKAPKPPKVKKNRNVPDFNKLPKRVMIGVAAVVLIGSAVFAQYFFKRATVTLVAAGQLVDVDTNFKVDPNADTISVTTATLPGKKYEISKDLAGSTPATGKKDIGTKATGVITLSNHCYNPGTVATGTRFQSSSGLIFVSTESVAVPDGTISAGSCNVKTVSVPVSASQNGDQYNIAPTSFSNASLPSSGSTYVKLTGSQMTGGTTKNVTVVTQADVDKVKTEAIDKQKDDITKELEAKVGSSQTILPDSFTASATNVVASPAVDAEGDQVSVKFTVAYSIMTIKDGDLDTFIAAVVKKQVGADKQIYQSGADKGKITAANGAYNFTGTASAGEKINTDELVQQIKGKRTGEATSIASKVPGVSRAQISLSPTWSVKLPTIIDRITLDIKVEEQ
jgi:hypothetical protein